MDSLSSRSPYDDVDKLAVDDIFNSSHSYGYPFLTPQSLRSAIETLRNNKASGSDKINVTQFKNLPKRPLVQLFKIFQISLNLAYFPTPWKTASIILIPKPGKNRTDPRSYRPVSLLNLCGKLLEKVILFEVNRHITDNNIIINE